MIKKIIIENIWRLVKERFYETKKLSYEINPNDLIYYFKGNTSRKKDLMISVMV